MTESNVTSITKKPNATPMEFTPEQTKIIRDSFLNGATEAEASVLLELARLRRLNPITRQIHFVKRWDREKNREVWSAQVGIDGFRAIAERTGLYDGQDEAEFEYDAKGAIKLARVRIYRKDWSRPAVGVAHFSEFVQTKKDGLPTHMWATKPHIMLSKCAEALAHRKAFPEDTAGLYAPEEMPEERDVTPPSEQPKTMAMPKKSAEVKAALAAQLGTVDAQVVKTEPKPEPAMPFDRIMQMGRDAGFSDKEIGAKVRELTGGKSKRSELKDEDAAKFRAWLEDMPTPPSDPEPPPAAFEESVTPF